MFNDFNKLLILKKQTMNKKLIFAIFIASVMAVSCSKKDTAKDPGTDTSLTNPTYTDKTDVQIKSDLESTGTQMVSQLQSLDNEKGTSAAVSLLSLLSSSNTSSTIKNSSALKTLGTIAAVSQRKSGAKELATRLKAAGSDPVLTDEFDSIAGTYTYNFDTKDFDFVADPTKDIIILFPASDASKTSMLNDGTIDIARPTVLKGSFTYGDAVITELPKSLGFTVKVGTEQVISYSFTAAYNADGVPTDVKSDLNIGTFLFEITWGYHSADLSVNYLFKHAATTILDLGVELKGNFDKSKIIALDTTENPDPTQVLTNANAHFQFMDVKIAGTMDFKSMWSDMNAIKDDSSRAINETAVMNKDIQLVIFYVSTGKAIAKAEFYVKYYTYYGYQYNNDGGYTYSQITDRSTDVKLVFKEGSKATLKAYFNDGFDSLITDINTFIKQLNDNHGLNLKPVTKG